MKQNKHGKTGAIRVLFGIAFLIYLYCLLYVLFLWGGRNQILKTALQTNSYLFYLKRHLQLVPFRTISIYSAVLPETFSLHHFAVVNLAGNFLLCFPMGIFLPFFWKSQRKFSVFAVTMLCMILAVELTQLVTLTGACDVDDVLLNFPGALTGFGCFHLFAFFRSIIHGKNQRL